MRNNKKGPGRYVQQKQQSMDFKVKSISPLNDRQAKVLRSKKNLVLTGYAGTGKTFLTSYLGYQEMFAGNYEKLIYMRSAVPTRNTGFLPGSQEEKMAIYEAPYIDIASELFERGDAYDILKKKGLVHFTSTSYVRGINLRNAVVVVDETQNMTYHELDSIITRLNDNCKIMFCGDIRQADLYKNGLQDFYSVLKEMNEFDFVDFQKEDIVRSDLVRNYIIKKEEILNKM
jgi:phosphate starvation-inducible protein PhoH